MNLGILGGTFDPPHVGHLVVADEVRAAVALDTVLFIPAWRSPHKRRVQLTDPVHRLRMVRLAVARNPEFAVSDLELRRGGISYTVDTLEELHRRFSRHRLFLLIGMDNLQKFDTWKSPQRILELATIVVMTRAGVPVVPIPKVMADHTVTCPVPEIGISSSDIRKRIRSGKPFRHLVPERVYDYIIRHKLYGR